MSAMYHYVYNMNLPVRDGTARPVGGAEPVGPPPRVAVAQRTAGAAVYLSPLRRNSPRTGAGGITKTTSSPLRWCSATG